MKYQNIIKNLINNYELKKEYTFEEFKKLFDIDNMHDFYNEMNNYINPNYIIEVSFIKYKVIITKHIKLSIDNKITDIRGSIWDCKITFENGYVLKCNGNLDKDSFTIYIKSLKITEEEKEILKTLIKENIKKTTNSFITIK